MTSRVRTALIPAVAAVVALLLAGCAGIPQAGPVQVAREQSSPDDLGDVILLPDGPAPGQDQETILNGFLRAGTSPQNDYAVAREFLSQDFAHVWDPNQGTTVDTGERPQQQTSAASITLQVTPTAQVDSNGEYTESSSQGPSMLQYTFVQENGEWRINAAPPGILLEQFRFEQVFASHPIYFYDPTFTYLVPDLRWFPRLAATGTRIVRAVLAGPTPWLRGAVVSAFPDGTSTTAVVTSSGQANVDLSANVLNADPVTKRRMSDQLRFSLTSLPGVSTIQLTVNQSPLTIVDNATASPIVNPRVDSRTLVMKDGVFGYLSGDQVAPIPDISDKMQQLNPTAAMYSASQRIAVALTAGGVAVIRAPADAVMIDARPNLIAPSIDARGYVWSVPSGAPDQLLATAPDGTQTPIATNWSGATGITSLEVSRDGTRVLALLSAGSQVQLVAAGVIRDQNGVPQRLGAPNDLAASAGTGVGATWVDEDDVASLTATATGSQITQQEIGGKSEPLGPLAVSGVAIAGSNDLDGLRVRDSGGALQQPRGNGWQLVVPGVSMLAKQY